MNPAVIIVTLVAVVGIVALVLFVRRLAAGKAEALEGEGAGRPEGEPSGAAKPAQVGPVTAVPPEEKVEEAEAARSVAEVEQEAERVEEAPAKPPPVETEEEVAERVKESLAGARRMLKELQEGEAEPEALHGTMNIMAEGLQEVEALADRRKWSQARDKAEALHAQLKLMLQSARREDPSD